MLLVKLGDGTIYIIYGGVDTLDIAFEVSEIALMTLYMVLVQFLDFSVS